VGDLRELLDVRTGGEDLLAAVDDDRVDVRPLGSLLGGGLELGLHLAVQGVHRRPIQPDRADPVLDLEPDELSHAPSKVVATAVSRYPAVACHVLWPSAIAPYFDVQTGASWCREVPC
jgi:hypothetical protein